MTKWPSVIVKRRSSFPTFVSDRGQRIFSFQAVRSPRGCPAWTERGNGHRTSSPTVDGGHSLEVPRLIQRTEAGNRLRGDAGHLGHEPPLVFSLTCHCFQCQSRLWEC